MMALKLVDIEKSPQDKDDSRHNRRLMQFRAERDAIKKKFAGRGASGAAEAKKQINELNKKITADVGMGDLYGLDSPKARSYGQSTQPKQGKIVTGKAKGGAVKNYKHGGAVMKGRGGSFKGIK
jgi:hypothetical protein